jgi:hypothetical protein
MTKIEFRMNYCSEMVRYYWCHLCEEKVFNPEFHAQSAIHLFRRGKVGVKGDHATTKAMIVLYKEEYERRALLNTKLGGNDKIISKIHNYSKVYDDEAGEFWAPKSYSPPESPYTILGNALELTKIDSPPLPHKILDQPKEEPENVTPPASYRSYTSNSTVVYVGEKGNMEVAPEYKPDDYKDVAEKINRIWMDLDSEA